MIFEKYLAQKPNMNDVIKLILLTVCLYVGMVFVTWVLLSQYNATFKDYIFNLQIGYTSEQVYHSLKQLNPTLVRAYPMIAALDAIIALLYGGLGTYVLYQLVLRVTSNKVFLLGSFSFLLAGFINVLEDIVLSTLFIQYPKQLFALVRLASLLTFLKYVFLLIGLLLLIAFGAIFLRRRYFF